MVEVSVCCFCISKDLFLSRGNNMLHSFVNWRLNFDLLLKNPCLCGSDLPRDHFKWRVVPSLFYCCFSSWSCFLSFKNTGPRGWGRWLKLANRPQLCIQCCLLWWKPAQGMLLRMPAFWYLCLGVWQTLLNEHIFTFPCVQNLPDNCFGILTPCLQGDLCWFYGWEGQRTSLQTPSYFPCLYQIFLLIYLQNKGKIQEHLLY